MSDNAEETRRQIFWEVKWQYLAENPATGRTFTERHIAYAIADQVVRWWETKDRAFLDYAVQICEQLDLPVLPVLRSALAQAAFAARQGKTSRPEREMYKHKAMRMVANLVIRGETLTSACEGVSAKMAAEIEYFLKASSLEKEYVRVWRRKNQLEPSLEDELKEFNEKNPVQSFEEDWASMRKDLPKNSSQAVKGTRR